MKDTKISNGKKYVILAICLTLIFVVSALLFFASEPVQKNVVSEFLYKTSETALNPEVGEENNDSSNVSVLNNTTQTGKVIVKYVDTEGNELKTSDVLQGVVGKEYSVQRPEIEGYITYGKDPMNKIGLYEETDITVEFKYISAINNVAVNSQNNTVTVTVGNVKQATEYSLRIACEDTDGNKIDYATFKVTNQANELLKQAKTMNGKILAGAIVIREEGEETYNIEHLTAPRSYKKLLNDKVSIKLTKTWDAENSAYKATFNYDEVDGATVEIKNNEILVTVKVEKILLYNISTKKYLRSIDGINVDGREPSVLNIEHTDYANRTVTYKTNTDDVHVKNGQSLIYNIRVYNEGNTQVMAGEITDNIPEGLIYDTESTINQEYEWKMYKDDGTGNLVETDNAEEATTVKTNYLKTTVINGFEDKTEGVSFKEVQIELKTTTKKSRLDRELVNVASVEKQAKEVNIADNEATEKVILDKVIENNLVLKKFTAKINDVATTQREPVVSIDANNKVVYEQPTTPLEVSNGEKVVFGLRIYNESEDVVTGSEVIDEIPNYLLFVKDSEINNRYGWDTYKKDAEGNLVQTDDEKEITVIKTNYLTTKQFNAFNKAVDTTPYYEDIQVELKVTDEKITSNVEVEKEGQVKEIENEVNVDDNNDSEKIIITKTKIKALGLEKFVSKVDNTVITGRIPVATVGADEKVTYEKTGSLVKAKNNQEVEFTLRMYSEGNVDTEGQEVVDNIPEGLIYDKENEVNKAYGWKMYTKDAGGNLVETEDETKAVAVKTSYFVNKTINAIEGTNVSFEDAKLVLKVTDNKIETSKQVTNTAKMPNYVQGPYEPNPGDKEAKEPIVLERTEIKALGFKKFVSKVDNTVVSGREPVVTINSNGSLSYSQSGEIVKVENNQKVEFTLRMYSEGNTETEGQEILDNIPEGLIYDKENETNKAYGWKMYTKDARGNLVETEDETKATVVKTDYLTTKTIEKVQGVTVSSEDVKLVLTVTDKKIETDTKVINTANMPNYVIGAYEPTLNDKDAEEPVIIAKTKIEEVGIAKFVSKVDSTVVTSREPVATVEANGNITYTKNGDIEKVKNNQEVEFTLRMYNEGNVTSEGYEIIDNIPAGLIFEKENITNKAYGWKMYTKDAEGNLIETEDETKATVVKTNYFKTKTIEKMQGTTVNYEDAKLVLKVTAEKIENDTQIVNKAEIPNYVSGAYDLAPGSEKAEEPVIMEKTIVKALGFRKFVSKVDTTVITGREPKVTVEADGSITYVKTGDVVKVKNNQEVEFTLRMYNEGNVASEGQEIIDNIPEGLIYDKENAINKAYGWKMYTKDAEGNLVETEDETKAVAVKTNYFTTKTIGAIEETTVKYEDAKLVLKVTAEKIEADKQIVNTAKMPNYVPGPYDPTPTEDPEEPLIIEETKIKALGFKKFVSKVDDTVITERTPIVTINANGSLSYTQNGDVVKVENNQEVEFTLRMYSQGNVETEGQEIIDNIPEGLIYDKENEINKAYGWKMYTKDAGGNLVETEDETKAVAVKTNYLATKTIGAIEENTVKYEDAKLVLKVTDEKIDSDTRVVNTAKMPNYVIGTYEPTLDDKNAEEPVIIGKTKIQEAGMAKFVSKVDDNEILGREPQVTVEANGNITYTKTGEIVKVKNNQRVEFTLRMYNEGNVTSEGQEIMDNIPEGLIFDKENETNKAYGWKMYAKDENGNLVETEDETKATVVKTNYLTTKTIEKIQGTTVNYADAKLILKVTEDKIEADTKIVNTAKMPNYVPGPYDPTPGNEDPEEPLIIEETEVKALGFKKFVSKVDNTVITGRAPKVTVEANGNITYEKTGDIVKVKNNQKVEFTLRMYNEGNVVSEGQEIIDNIPEGLIYDKENAINKSYGWKMYTKDENGNLVETEDETKAVAVKTNYFTTKTIGAIEGSTVKYEDAKLVLTVTKEKIEADKQIVNTAKMPNYVPGPYDPTPGNEDPEEPLIIEETEVKALGFKKFVSKVDSTVITGREPVVTVGEHGSITYTKTGDVVKVENNQKVEFTLRMYNEGNVVSEGQEIIDNIPEGLIYDKENETNKAYGWKMYTKDENGNLVETEDETKAVAVKTNYFVNKTIGAIEENTVKYEDAKLVLTVTEEKIEADKQIINTAKMPNYVPGPYDPTPDDKDPEEPLIIEKTKIKEAGMAKFVSKVDDTVIVGRETQVTVEANGNITYAKTGDIVKVKNNQRVEFTLRMYNEGNVTSEGQEIMDNIPEGLIYDKENETNKAYGWKMYAKDENGNLVETEDETKATVVKTNYFETQTIEAVQGTTVNYADAKLILRVTEDKIEADTKIVNTAKMPNYVPGPYDPTPGNEDPEEPLIIEKTEVKALGFKKFVSKVDNNEILGREPIVNVESDGKVIYVKNGDVVKVKNSQEVEFTLRMYNEGNVASKGQEIIDNIPEGLIFDKENETNKAFGWKMYTKDEKGNLVETEDETKAVAVKTNYFTEKTIGAIEGNNVKYEDVKLVLKVTEERINADTQIINTAKMPNYVPGPYDPTPDDKDPEEPLIIEKTEVYDLAMKIFANSVNGIVVEGRAPIATADEKGNVTYTQSSNIAKASNGEKIEFILRVYNEGNMVAKPTEVIDTIPQGLIFDKDSDINSAYNWKMYTKDEKGNLVETEDETKALVVKTNYLELKTLSGVENGKVSYEDVKLILKVTDDEIIEDTKVINIAKVEKLEKENITQNNEGREEVILEQTKEGNLVLKKFVTKLDDEEIKDRQPSVSVDANGKIEYRQNENQVLVANNQKVEFTLRVYNEGRRATNGVEVIDNIPDGLVFDKENETNKTYGWKMYAKDENGNLVETEDETKAVAVKTDYLTKEEIDKYNEELRMPSYKDVKVVLKVDESKIDKDRTIVNTAVITGSDEKPEDNEGKEELKVKYFDLDITKYVSRIEIEDDEDSNVYEYGIEHKGQVFKADLDAKKVKNTKIYITYTLQVKNIGEIEGYAKELTDYIPEGLSLIEDENWEEENGKAISRSLENEIIKPGESKVITVDFVWDISDGKVGNKENEAKITKYYNKFDATDITEGNSDKENIIISIRTGAEKTVLGIVAVVLVTTLGIVVILKRRNSKVTKE